VVRRLSRSSAVTAEDLIAEGERLAKPSLFLAEAPAKGEFAAYWGGPGRAGYRGRPDDRHRLTFDCGWLAEHAVRLRGSVGVYDVAQRWKWPKPIHLDRVDAPITDLGLAGGAPLYAREVPSFPPLAAVCLYGSPAVEAWLSNFGLDRTDYEVAETTEAGSAYQEEYRTRCPLYIDDKPVAVLGGWHAIWPSDEFYLPREMRLALWTFRGAEPWLEVFERSPNLSIRLRIT
jgi:hypothetical protein